MVTVKFSLTPDASARLHDHLICLAKFNESVYLEARHDKLSITTLNSSKSAYASFVLHGPKFFLKYAFSGNDSASDARFTCRMYNKALLSVFKGRLVDSRGRDTAIDRCDVSVQDQPSETECRFVVKMICEQGVTKTYKLTYESVETMHALFDKSSATNHWRMHSRVLREFIEYFGPKTEQLDIYSEDGRVTFTSFTEKIVDGKEVLKQPLQTSVSVNATDFEEFKAQEKLHIIISVKDFKAIVSHADNLRTSLTCLFSIPARPMQFCYGDDGMSCEFTLVTTGDYRGTPAPNPATTIVHRAASTAQTATTSRAESQVNGREMAPPRLSKSRAARRLQQSSVLGQGPSQNQPEGDSLFVPVEEEDRQWEPQFPAEDDHGILGWNASADNDIGLHPTFRDSVSFSKSGTYAETDEGLAPTQRISQIRGLFD